MAVSLSGVVPGLSPIVQPSAVTTSPSARVLRPRPTCRYSRRSWHHRSYRTMGAAQLPGFSTSFTIGLTPCSRQLSGARRSSHAPSALTNRREEVTPRGNDSREGPDEKVHTMRAVWSTDAPDWLRDWGQGEDRLSIQVRELRAHAREDAQGRSISLPTRNFRRPPPLTLFAAVITLGLVLLLRRSSRQGAWRRAIASQVGYHRGGDEGPVRHLRSCGPRRGAAGGALRESFAAG